MTLDEIAARVTELRADGARSAMWRTDEVESMLAALRAVEAACAAWTARGEHDMAYSKTIPDENIADVLLTDGADMVERARIISNTIREALGL